MKKNFYYLHTVFFFLTLSLQSQNENKKWGITFGSASVLYSVEDGPDMGGRYIAQFPRLSLSRYMFKSVTFVGSISASFKDVQKYTTFDGEARYDFGTSNNRISPYIMIGGSLIASKHLLPTLNFGAGGTFWVSEKFGLTGQLAHRYNEERFKSQRSHTFASAGIIFRFSFSSEGNSKNSYSSNKNIIRDSKRKRLWDNKN